MKKIKLLAFLLTTSFTLFANENMAPPAEKQKGPGSYWKQVRNAAADAEFSLDSKTTPPEVKNSLKIILKSPGGYGEWRIDPLLNLEPGIYTFSVLVKNNTEKKPYFRIYSFDDKNNATVIGGRNGEAGKNTWYLLSHQFTVKSDSVKIRVGLGLSSSKGSVWFAKPILLKGKHKIKVPFLKKKAPLMHLR